MIKINGSGAFFSGGVFLDDGGDRESARKKTMTYAILEAHNGGGDMRNLRLRFDALASHDITYVGIIQTARASGLERFPLPYVLTNCHNSLCAVGGTINEDDHLFGLSAARKYGGEFVPAHMAVIHQYMREMYAAPGKMILASDSHTRYGPCGTLSVGEGGPELVKQLLSKTYDIGYPDVAAVYLHGEVRPGVGPQDVALALIGAVFEKGLVKNKVLEFVGPGISKLNMDFRFGIDVMTTETTCLSSVWETDGTVRAYLERHLRGGDYRDLSPAEGAYYDMVIDIDLSKVEPMIALPFHPSNAHTIKEFKENAGDILNAVDRMAVETMSLKARPRPLTEKLRDGKFFVDQGFIGGCSGGLFQNILRARDILAGGSPGDGAFSLSVYPASQPMMLELTRNGAVASLIEAGATVRTAFCGPCFGAGDVPSNEGFSIRHATRNFPNREGSKPGEGQLSYVALMDARSIAATARNGGELTSAFELENPLREPQSDDYIFDPAPYDRRVYRGVGKAEPEAELRFGPNIADWPKMIELPENLLVEVASAIYDEITTTDELIPSGETSSYRSNPMRLAQFTLSRKDPGYVARAERVLELERLRQKGLPVELPRGAKADISKTGFGTAVFALKPGDGSAREQAASCQRVLGGVCNIAGQYATKRYRSNVINWGMIPFTLENAKEAGFETGDLIYIEGIRAALFGDAESVNASVFGADGEKREITLFFAGLTRDERDIILAGCLINYYGK